MKTLSSRRRWRDAPLWLKSLALGIVPAVILLISTVIGYRLHLRVDQADAELSRASSVQNDIQTIHILLAEMSLGVRGYALTERRDFLAPYQRARGAIAMRLAQMRGRIRDPEVLKLHGTISELFEQKFRDLERLLKAVDAGTRGADLLPLLIESKDVLDQLRSRLGDMHARELSLVTSFSRDVRAATQRSYQFNLLASLLILGSSAATVILLLTDILRRIGRLAVNAEQLVRDAPLAVIDTARDELGVLGERLQNASLLLAARAAEARSANEAKSRFLSRTSHEFRTPLNAIIGHAQLLERQVDDPAVAQATEQIDRAARHLLQLIDDILDLSIAESGELRLVREAVDVARVVDEARALLAPTVDPMGIAVSVAPDCPPLSVLADPMRLRQVLLNLLSNAIKFNRPGGTVRIVWRASDADACIDIEDSGLGISDEDLARLFVPLERLDADRRGISGSGLGLSLSRQLLATMGGTITASSRPEQGSVFSITLPRSLLPVASSTAITAAAPAIAARAAPQPATRRLLLVGAGPDDRALLAALLVRRPQWSLHAVNDAQAAVDAMASARPDRIVIACSDANGAPLVRCIAKSIDAALPIAVLGVPESVASDSRVAVTTLTRPLQLRPFFDWLDS
jgi:signal transduction histidine kinase